MLKALKERIKALEVENIQLHSILNTATSLNDQLLPVQKDLEEEQSIRVNLQERFRVILEELENVKKDNLELQTQMINLLQQNHHHHTQKEPINENKLIIEKDSMEDKEIKDLRREVETLKSQVKSAKTQSNDEAVQHRLRIAHLEDNLLDWEAKYTHLRQVFQRLLQNPGEQV